MDWLTIPYENLLGVTFYLFCSSSSTIKVDLELYFVRPTQIYLVPELHRSELDGIANTVASTNMSFNQFRYCSLE